MSARIKLLALFTNSIGIIALAQTNNTTFTYQAGPNFCLAEYGFTVPVFCTAPGELPLGSFPLPQVGGYYVDPNFGAKVSPLTDGTADTHHQYSSPSAFSATGKYALIENGSGHPRIVEVATGNIVIPDLTPTMDLGYQYWSPLDDDILYVIGTGSAPTQIFKYQVSTRQKTVLIDYATDGHNFSNISFGGTGDIAPDLWVSFIAQNEHQICAADLKVMRTYCADYTAPNPNNRVGWDFIDYSLITKGKDVDSGKRYVMLMANPAIGVYSVNEQTGKLDFEFRGPEMPRGVMGGDTTGVGNKDGVCDPGEYCFQSRHTDVFQDDAGRQYFFVDQGVDVPACEDDLVTLQISKGLNMFGSVESGGGRKVITTIFKCGLGWAGMHFGCARASAYCVAEFYTSPANLPNQIESGVTAFDGELIVMRGNGAEIRRVAMHRSVFWSYWDQPRACISQDGSMILWDSNYGNPAIHRVMVAQTGFGAPTSPGGGSCSYTLNITTLTVGAAGSSGTIAVTPSATTCPAPTASSNVTWASASATANTISWSVTANTSSQPRTGSLSIAGQTVAISQLGVVAPVTMTLFPAALNLGAAPSGLPQSVTLSFAGGVGSSWTASSNQPNIKVTPASGVGNATLQISATAGSAGVVTINAPGVANSPQTVQVQVTSPPVTAPFGSFDTPVTSTNPVSAAIAVTGWALDAIEVSKVDIWREPIGREPPGGLIYVGDAVFVTGARPDVARAFADYPNANRAGWGYLLLTNFLPNPNSAVGSGNGMYTLHALAHNRSGLVTDLGSRAIMVDNTHATLPFGNIDTPAQGALAFGNAYVNFGWALTPTPAAIPTDGTTITVNVDGITLGHPNYSQFRVDIATLFPGFANSDAAVGFFYIDTTKLTNGLHTIAWNVFDDKLRGNGVGSRFFSVLNVPTGPVAAPADASLSDPPVKSPDPGLLRTLEVEEMDRIQVPVGGTTGYLLENGERQPLPVGSTLQEGVFYWQLAPVFLGEYNLVFERPSARPAHLRIVVHPKKYATGEAQADQ